MIHSRKEKEAIAKYGTEEEPNSGQFKHYLKSDRSFRSNSYSGGDRLKMDRTMDRTTQYSYMYD